MIRTACIAATIATSAIVSAQSANAAVNLNARIELLTNILYNDAQFSGRDFSFSVRNGGGSVLLFKGIAGVRGFDNYTALNEWVGGHAGSKGVFQGGSYQFTHSVLDSFFGSASAGSAAPSVFDGGPYKFTHSVLDSYFPDPAPASATPGVFEGEPYKFTHSVLDSYFDAPGDARIVAQSTLVEPMFQPMMAIGPAPIPEPETWAMMIGGFALVGAMMRSRRAVPRAA